MNGFGPIPPALVRYGPAALVASSVALAHAARARLGPLDVHAESQLPVLCPFRWVTDLPCPTCGLGRALLASWSGELLHGFSHHPLGPLLLLAAIGLSLALALRPTAARLHVRRWSRALATRPALMATLVTMYVVWGFGRQLAP